MKKILKYSTIVICLPVVYIALAIVYGTITRYKPDPIETISEIGDGFYINDSSIYSALIWNIGYAGLGANMDFFYDGGTKVRDNKDNTQRNLFFITEFLQQNDSIDFILLQEVDEKSKRSYHLNMVEHLNLALPEHFPFFAYNYKASFVPIPVLQPMGRVNSGLLTFSKYVPVKTTRNSFPGNFGWPKNIFMLNRCYLVNHFQTETGKDFIIVNTHNSAYDDGSLRSQQNDALIDFLKSENSASFVVGGDWNQCPDNFDPKSLKGCVFDSVNYVVIDEAYKKNDWRFYFDNSVPTNRRVKTSYNKGVTPTTLIDYFLVSEQINVLSCETIDLGFAYSDHQPVIITFTLN